MKDWFATLEARERVFVATGAIVAGIAILYVLVWMPLDKGQQRLAASVSVAGRASELPADKTASAVRASAAGYRAFIRFR